MKRMNIQNILDCPLIAALAGVLWVFGSTACSEEQVLPSPDNPRDAPTTLRIRTKGITTTAEDGNLEQLEDYVKTLRIFFFNGESDTQPYMWYSPDLSTETAVTDGDDEIVIKLDHEFPDGNYIAYAVANEQDNMFTEAETEDKNVSMTIDQLKAITVSMSAAPVTVSVDNPIPMSYITKEQIFAENNNMTIELVRTVAKVTLASVTLDGEPVTPTSYTLSASGDVYTTYSLFKEGEDEAGGTEETKLSDGASATNSSFYLPIADAGITIGVSVTLEDGKTYTGQLSLADRSIKRNDEIKINATISRPQNCLQLNVSVAPWEVDDLKPSYQ